jgi:hypothetical protein
MRVRHLCITLLAALLCSCTSGTGPPADQPVTRQDTRSLLTQAAAGAAEPNPAGVQSDAAQISSAPAPEGIDPALWRQLTAELERVVQSRQPATAEFQPVVISASDRQASFTPYGAANKISDLRISGSGPFWLTWHYRNNGDYDLNGEVNISDLTPIALNFGASSPDINWPEASLADGDLNGEVNISDITPIGQSFQGTLTGYRLYATDDPPGEWTSLGNATLATNLYRGTDHPFFRIRLDSLDFKYYALWPFDGSEDEGGWSNITGPEISVLRKITGVKSLW